MQISIFTITPEFCQGHLLNVLSAFCDLQDAGEGITEAVIGGIKPGIYNVTVSEISKLAWEYSVVLNGGSRI